MKFPLMQALARGADADGLLEFFLPGTPGVGLGPKPSLIDVQPDGYWFSPTLLASERFLFTGMRLAIVSPMEVGDFVTFSFSIGASKALVASVNGLSTTDTVFPVLSELVRGRIDLMNLEIALRAANTKSVRCYASLLGYRLHVIQ